MISKQYTCTFKPINNYIYSKTKSDFTEYFFRATIDADDRTIVFFYFIFFLLFFTGLDKLFVYS